MFFVNINILLRRTTQTLGLATLVESLGRCGMLLMRMRRRITGGEHGRISMIMVIIMIMMWHALDENEKEDYRRRAR